MHAVVPERLAEEAGTDELAAFASLLVRGPHIPSAIEDDDEDLELDAVGGVELSSTDVVLPRQRDEFVCPRCFLVLHLSRRVGGVCRDCA